MVKKKTSTKATRTPALEDDFVVGQHVQPQPSAFVYSRLPESQRGHILTIESFGQDGIITVRTSNGVLYSVRRRHIKPVETVAQCGDRLRAEASERKLAKLMTEVSELRSSILNAGLATTAEVMDMGILGLGTMLIRKANENRLAQPKDKEPAKSKENEVIDVGDIVKFAHDPTHEYRVYDVAGDNIGGDRIPLVGENDGNGARSLRKNTTLLRKAAKLGDGIKAGDTVEDLRGREYVCLEVRGDRIITQDSNGSRHHSNTANYRLKRPAEIIDVGDIVQFLEDPARAYVVDSVNGCMIRGERLPAGSGGSRCFLGRHKDHVKLLHKAAKSAAGVDGSVRGTSPVQNEPRSAVHKRQRFIRRQTSAFICAALRSGSRIDHGQLLNKMAKLAECAADRFFGPIDGPARIPDENPEKPKAARRFSVGDRVQRISSIVYTVEGVAGDRITARSGPANTPIVDFTENFIRERLFTRVPSSVQKESIEVGDIVTYANGIIEYRVVGITQKDLAENDALLLWDQVMCKAADARRSEVRLKKKHVEGGVDGRREESGDERRA